MRKDSPEVDVLIIDERPDIPPVSSEALAYEERKGMEACESSERGTLRSRLFHTGWR